MADLLLELFSEEIPARMQKRASDDLKSLLEGVFKASDVEFKAIDTYSTPRRITAHVTGLPAKTPDISEERRGPKVGAPDQAVAGFSRGAGVDPKDLIEKDGYYYARIDQKGEATSEVLAKAFPELIINFPWPKSMRWGSGRFRWVRPLHSTLCILDGKVVPFEVDGVKSGDKTQGHRFLSAGSFSVKNFKDYKHQLNKHYVMLEPADRRKVILAEAEKVVKNQSLKVIMDDGLLNEVAGLVEWPVVHLGTFDEAFLDIPEEALVSEMRHHQKYFPVFDEKTSKLSNHFVFVSNMVTADKGAAITKGNERVIAARLHDAKFFWDQDRKIKLEDRLPKLDEIVFHEKMGSVAERAARIEKLVGKIAPFVPKCDAKKAMRAAKLAKADLVSGMVGEFPDLQGVMGGYYAEAQGEGHKIAGAIRDQYSPKGPSDECPNAPTSVALALAENLEKLISFWSIDEKPTGSKDPFALRRAALSAIRLITENNLQFCLVGDLGIDHELMDFIIERLKVSQKEKNIRHDIIEAVFSLRGEGDIVHSLLRVRALQTFLNTEDGNVLLAGYKRAANIVKIEERKDKVNYIGLIKENLLVAQQEKFLYQSLMEVFQAVLLKIQEEEFELAMENLAKMRKPIDEFFENVTVNCHDKEIRKNRLTLLNLIKSSIHSVADFSKIEG